MRLAPNTDTVPVAVNRYLLPRERQVIAVHRHPAALLGPSALVVGGLVAAAIVSGVSGLSGDALLLVWLTWTLMLLYLLGRVLNYSLEYYALTSLRIVYVKGFLGRDVAMMPLAQATGMKLRRSVMGMILGYGQFIMDPCGQDQAMRNLNFVPYPEQFYLEACALIYRDNREPEPELPTRTYDGAPGPD